MDVGGAGQEECGEVGGEFQAECDECRTWLVVTPTELEVIRDQVQWSCSECTDNSDADDDRLSESDSGSESDEEGHSDLIDDMMSHLEKLDGLDQDSELDPDHGDFTGERPSQAVQGCAHHIEQIIAEDAADEPYSYVLGDIFHLQQRPIVPVRHEFKKAYYISLRDAFLIMDPEYLAQVHAVMEGKDMDAKDIRAVNLWPFDYFKQRVPRVCPSPKLLEARVKAVFDYYSDFPDSKTDKPLFNSKAKKKAKGVLSDIRKGLISDPPGVNFYHHILDKNCEPAKDGDGLFLFR